MSFLSFYDFSLFFFGIEPNKMDSLIIYMYIYVCHFEDEGLHSSWCHPVSVCRNFTTSYLALTHFFIRDFFVASLPIDFPFWLNEWSWNLYINMFLFYYYLFDPPFSNSDWFFDSLDTILWHAFPLFLLFLFHLTNPIFLPLFYWFSFSLFFVDEYGTFFVWRRTGNGQQVCSVPPSLPPLPNSIYSFLFSLYSPFIHHTFSYILYTYLHTLYSVYNHRPAYLSISPFLYSIFRSQSVFIAVLLHLSLWRYLYTFSFFLRFTYSWCLYLISDSFSSSLYNVTYLSLWFSFLLVSFWFGRFAFFSSILSIDCWFDETNTIFFN